ncbi:MAG: RNA polymerase sigma factor [Flavobacteriales bacterium]
MFKTKIDKTTLSDEELIKEILKNQRADDYGIIYDRYSQKVFQKSISFVKDVDVAKDLAHDIFIKCYVNLSKFNFESKFSTWLYRLTYNFCIDYLRKNNKFVKSSAEELEHLSDDDSDLQEKKLLALRAERLQKVLEEIPTDDKAVLLMKFQDGMSVKEIMPILNCGESAVKMRIKRAKSKALETYKNMFGDE